MRHLKPSQELIDIEAGSSQPLDEEVRMNLPDAASPIHPCLQPKKSIKVNNRKRRHSEGNYPQIPYKKKQQLDINKNLRDASPEPYELGSVEDDESCVYGKLKTLCTKILSGSYASVDQLEQLSNLFSKVDDFNENLLVESLIKVVAVLCDLIKKGVEVQQCVVDNKRFPDWRSIVERSVQAVAACLNLFLINDLPLIVYSEESIENIFLFLTLQLNGTIQALRKKLKHNFQFSYVSLKKNFGLLGNFVNKHYTVDANFHALLTSCINGIFVNLNMDVQIALISLVATVFKKQEAFRAHILSEIIYAIKKTPECSKPFYFDDCDSKISMFTVLILSLTQNSMSFPKLNNKREWLLKEGQKILTDSYETSVTVAGKFIVTFLDKCFTAFEDHKNYRTSFASLVADLLEIQYVPHCPSASFLLQLISKATADIFLKPKDPNMRVFCIKILHSIGLALKKGEKIQGENEKKLLGEISHPRPQEVMEKVILQYLDSNPGDTLFTDASDMHQILWFITACHKNCSEKEKLFIMRLREGYNSKDTSINIESNDMRTIICYLDSRRYNHADSNVYLKYLLRGCFDTNKKVKSTAAHSLSDFVSADPSLLSDSIVFRVIEECLKASAAGSREAMCLLIGKYLTESVQDYNKYYTFILSLLEDKSVSVKKASIGVVKQILKIYPQIEHKEILCYKVLAMVQDEEQSVQKMVVDFFSDIWFTGEKFKQHLQTLIKMIEFGNTKNWLRQLLEEILRPKETSVTSQTQTQPDTQIQNMCSELSTFIIEQCCTSKDVVPYLRLLIIFCDTYPKMLIPFYETVICILLKADSKNDYLGAQHAAELLTLVMPCMTVHNNKVYATTFKKLTKQARKESSLNYPTRYWVAVMNLLKQFSTIIGYSMIDEWLKPNYEVLLHYKKDKHTQEKAVVVRAIIITGYLRDLLDNNGDIKKQDVEHVLEFFLESPVYRITTIHIFCLISEADKTIMKNKVFSGIITTHLLDHSVPIHTKGVLYAIQCFLQHVKDIDAVGTLKFRDESSFELISSVLQKHLKGILDCTLSPNVDIRKTATTILDIILNNGLIIDPRLILHLVSASTDPVSDIRNIGIFLLKKMKARRNLDLVRSSAQAIKLTFRLHKSLSNTTIVRGFHEVGGKFVARNNFIYLLHQENVNDRRQIIDNIINEVRLGAIASTGERLYLIDHLCSFSYKYQDEVYYVLTVCAGLYSQVILPTYPTNAEETSQFLLSYFGCYLLTYLKSYVQRLYAVSDQKLAKYSPLTPVKDLVREREHKCDYAPSWLFENNMRTDTLLEEMYSVFKKIETIDSSQSSIEGKIRPVNVASSAILTPTVKNSEAKVKDSANKNKKHSMPPKSIKTPKKTDTSEEVKGKKEVAVKVELANERKDESLSKKKVVVKKVEKKTEDVKETAPKRRSTRIHK